MSPDGQNKKRSSVSKQQLRMEQLAGYGNEHVRSLMFLQALANPVRMMILRELKTGSRNVSQLSQALGIEQPSISRHLKLLFDAHIVDRNKQLNEVYYYIREALAKKLESNLRWLAS